MRSVFENWPYINLANINLDWILNEVKALETEVLELNNAVAGYLNEAKQYTDEKNREVLEEVDRRTSALEKRLNNDYNLFVAKINANIVSLQTDFSTLRKDMAAAIVGANGYTDTRIEQNNVYILEEVGKGFVNLKVVNYFTGESVSVQEMFDYLSQFHLENAITYDQLATRSKTYTQMAAYDKTYTDLIKNGGTIIS